MKHNALSMASGGLRGLLLRAPPPSPKPGQLSLSNNSLLFYKDQDWRSIDLAPKTPYQAELDRHGVHLTMTEVSSSNRQFLTNLPANFAIYVTNLASPTTYNQKTSMFAGDPAPAFSMTFNIFCLYGGGARVLSEGEPFSYSVGLRLTSGQGNGTYRVIKVGDLDLRVVNNGTQRAYQVYSNNVLAINAAVASPFVAKHVTLVRGLSSVSLFLDATKYTASLTAPPAGDGAVRLGSALYYPDAITGWFGDMWKFSLFKKALTDDQARSLSTAARLNPN